MVEAVIWDFGGVFTSSPFEAFARFESQRGLPADIIRRTNALNHWENAWAKFERAEVDLETFDELFAAESLALGAEVRGRDVLPLLSGDLRPEMVEALRVIKSHFKMGCITNNLPVNAIGSASGRGLYIAEVMALFDHVIESAKIGLRKPDPRIYRMMVEALGVAPEACVYLDDLGINLKPAREMGMITIKVTDPEQAIAELEAPTGMKRPYKATPTAVILKALALLGEPPRHPEERPLGRVSKDGYTHHGSRRAASRRSSP